MNEYTIGYCAAGSIFGLSLTCLFYMLGGRSGKWRRRFVASFIQMANSNACAGIMGIWNPWLLAIYPIAIIQTSLGYGGDTAGEKIVKRIVCAAASLAIGGLFIFLYGPRMLWVFIPNAGVAAWTIWMGIRNPVYAAAEEVFVCALLFLMTNAYPFVPMTA